MKQNTRTTIAILFACLMLAASPISQADDDDSYGDNVGHKALNGFANLTTSVLEVPKNVINTTNQSNIFFGLVGGGFKGLLNAVGRTMVGLTDLVTAPLPTEQFVHPAYVWDDFDADTAYGDVFRLKDDPNAKRYDKDRQNSSYQMQSRY